MDNLNLLYSQHYAYVKNELRKWGCNRSVFEDIYQEAFVILLIRQHETGVQGRYNGKYIAQICKYLWYREQKRHKLTVNLDGLLDIPIHETDENSEINQLLLKHLKKLPGSCVEVLMLYALNYSEATITTKLGLNNRKQVNNKKNRCKQKLRTMIKEDPLYKELYG